MIQPSDKLVINSDSPEKTEKVAENLGKFLEGGDVALLYGDLGAGKTVFARGLIKGVTGQGYPARSPTFTLVNEYPGRIQVRHADLYRLKTLDELETIGLFDGDSHNFVTIVEWADRLPDKMKTGAVLVEIKDISESERIITICAGARIIDGMRADSV